MDIKKVNTVFSYVQAGQLALMSAQGILLISNKEKSFYLPIWIGLLLLSVIQVALVYKYPPKIKTEQMVDRSATLRIRLIALLPYLLILAGLTIAS